MKSAVEDSLETVLCSKTRISILKLLIDLGQLNVSQIAERLRSNYVNVLGNLKILEDNGLVRRLQYGRIKNYRLNEECSKVSALREMILAWQS